MTPCSLSGEHLSVSVQMSCQRLRYLCPLYAIKALSGGFSYPGSRTQCFFEKTVVFIDSLFPVSHVSGDADNTQERSDRRRQQEAERRDGEGLLGVAAMCVVGAAGLAERMKTHREQEREGILISAWHGFRKYVAL